MPKRRLLLFRKRFDPRIVRGVKKNGSIMITVLWTLMMISYLSGEYLAHNREKAGLAQHALDAVKEEQAVMSIIELFNTTAPPIPGYQVKNDEWMSLSPGGIALQVKLTDETQKININNAAETLIREKIKALFGEEGGEEEADALTDAILDWKDADNLVRLNGVEAPYYADKELPYKPSNGPFKVMQEIMLVKGMTDKLFWGNPLESLTGADETEVEEITEDEENATDAPASVIEGFTIYKKNVKRLHIILPGRGSSYHYEIIFLGKKGNEYKVLERCHTIISENCDLKGTDNLDRGDI